MEKGGGTKCNPAGSIVPGAPSKLEDYYKPVNNENAQHLFPQVKSGPLDESECKDESFENGETSNLKEECFDDSEADSAALNNEDWHETPAAHLIENDFKVTSFSIKDLVFAQLKGYPTWPSRVEEIIHNKSKYPKYRVFFFGSHDQGFVRHSCVKPFYPFRDEMKMRYIKNKKFQKAIAEVETSPDLVPAVHSIPEEDESNAGKEAAGLQKIRKISQSARVLPGSLFTSRSFFFGNEIDTGVMEKGLPPPKEPALRVLAENVDFDNSEMVSEEQFAETMKKLSKAVEDIKSSKLAKDRVDLILGKVIPVTALLVTPASFPRRGNLDRSQVTISPNANIVGPQMDRESGNEDLPEESDESFDINIKEMKKQMETKPFRTIKRKAAYSLEKAPEKKKRREVKE